MHIESIEIINFRGFKHEKIYLENYNCFVGPNGAGKSTVLNALNVFFRQNNDSKTDLASLVEDDFHHKDVSEPIEITVEFGGLSEEAKSDLSDYVRQDKLIVTAKAEFEEGGGRAPVKQYGNRIGFTGFRPWFEAEKQKSSASELKASFSELREKYPEIEKATSKAEMAAALRKFEADHPQDCDLIPSEDQFYGVSKGVNRLAPHIQWVFVSAAKDVSEEAEETKSSALGQLLGRAIRAKVDFSEKIRLMREALGSEYQAMLDAEQGVLTGLSQSLEARLRQWSNPSATATVKWRQDSEKSVRVEEPFAHILLGEKGYESEVSRFGHGMQRSYLLALLQELADLSDEGSPTLIMAIEEPELYQHPPQARYLAELLQELSDDNAQVMLCSHSPYFIPGDNFEQVRVVRESGEPCKSNVTSISYIQLAEKMKSIGGKHLKEEGAQVKLYPVLRPEISEMFFCRHLVLVEGIEDTAYITTYLQLMDRYSDYRRHGFHIVPVGGKSELRQPLAVAKMLEISVFVVCDADTDKEKPDEVVKHKQDNAAILNLMSLGQNSDWPTATISTPNLRMWSTNLTKVAIEELGPEWKRFEDEAAAHYGNAGGLKKNPLAISRALTNAWEENFKSASLLSVVEDILRIAEPDAQVKADELVEVTG